MIPAHLEALRWAAATERPGMDELDYTEPEQKTLLRLESAGLIEPVWTLPRPDHEQYIYAAKVTEAGRVVLAQQEAAERPLMCPLGPHQGSGATCPVCERPCEEAP